jgi:hypothetical protein
LPGFKLPKGKQIGDVGIDLQFPPLGIGKQPLVRFLIELCGTNGSAFRKTKEKNLRRAVLKILDLAGQKTLRHNPAYGAG